jgi:hypothetical protein
MLTGMLPRVILRVVRSEYPLVVEDFPDDILLEMISGGIIRAREFGLTNSEDIAGFVLIMFEVGPEFYNHAAIRSVLEGASIPAERKLDEVFAHTSQAVWDEVVGSLHRQTWFPELRQPEW